MHAQGYKVKDLEYHKCAFNFFNKLRLRKTIEPSYIDGSFEYPLHMI